MQPVSVTPKAGKVAFQYGLIFGIIQAVLASSILFINDLALRGQVGVALILTIVIFLTGLAAYFVAGILAVKQTGRLSTGTFAGMWTGAVYGVICCIISIVLFSAVLLPILSANVPSTIASPDSYRTGLVIGGIGGPIFGMLFAVGVGAGLGVLGGLIGRNISKVQPVSVAPVQPYFLGQPAIDPYSGQPLANPYPGQPAANPYSGQPYRGIEQ